MAKFTAKVRVSVMQFYSKDITVEAENKDEAYDNALEAAQSAEHSDLKTWTQESDDSEDFNLDEEDIEEVEETDQEAGNGESKSS